MTLYYWAITLFFMLAAYTSPRVIRLDPKAGLRMMLFITCAIFFNSAFSYLFPDVSLLHWLFPENFPAGHNTESAARMLMMIRPDELLRVWYEDVAYVWGSLVLFDKGFKKLSWLVLVAGIPSFVIGHLYQGPIGFMAILFPFIVRHLSLKYGAITVMMIHIFYDLTIHLNFQLIVGGP